MWDSWQVSGHPTSGTEILVHWILNSCMDIPRIRSHIYQMPRLGHDCFPLMQSSCPTSLCCNGPFEGLNYRVISDEIQTTKLLGY